MSEVRGYAIAVSDEWCFKHRNKKTLQAIGNVMGIHPDMINWQQMFIYSTEQGQRAAYNRFEALGANPVLIATPVFVDERYLK